MSATARRSTQGHGGDVVIYRAKDGRMNLDVRLARETVWLTQKQMSALFDKDSDTIGLHIRNIDKEKELKPGATAEESSAVQTKGKPLEKDAICKAVVNLINRENASC